MSCVVCKKYYNPRESRSYHQFPRDEETKEKWLEAIGVDHVTFGSKVCSDHFLPSDFHHISQSPTSKTRLFPNAVPSVNMERPKIHTNTNSKECNLDEKANEEVHCGVNRRKGPCSPPRTVHRQTPVQDVCSVRERKQMESFQWETRANDLLQVIACFYREGSNFDTLFNVEGKFLRAHKVILSAASPVFEVMLRRTPPKKTVFLKDVSYEDIKSVLDFIYMGSVDIPRTQVASFIRTAKFFRLRSFQTNDCLEVGASRGRSRWKGLEEDWNTKGDWTFSCLSRTGNDDDERETQGPPAKRLLRPSSPAPPSRPPPPRHSTAQHHAVPREGLSRAARDDESEVMDCQFAFVNCDVDPLASETPPFTFVPCGEAAGEDTEGEITPDLVPGRNSVPVRVKVEPREDEEEEEEEEPADKSSSSSSYTFHKPFHNATRTPSNSTQTLQNRGPVTVVNVNKLKD